MFTNNSQIDTSRNFFFTKLWPIQWLHLLNNACYERDSLEILSLWLGEIVEP